MKRQDKFRILKLKKSIEKTDNVVSVLAAASIVSGAVAFCFVGADFARAVGVAAFGLSASTLKLAVNNSNKKEELQEMIDEAKEREVVDNARTI